MLNTIWAHTHDYFYPKPTLSWETFHEKMSDLRNETIKSIHHLADASQTTHKNMLDVMAIIFNHHQIESLRQEAQALIAQIKTTHSWFIKNDHNHFEHLLMAPSIETFTTMIQGFKTDLQELTHNQVFSKHKASISEQQTYLFHVFKSYITMLHPEIASNEKVLTSINGLPSQWRLFAKNHLQYNKDKTPQTFDEIVDQYASDWNAENKKNTKQISEIIASKTIIRESLSKLNKKKSRLEKQSDPDDAALEQIEEDLAEKMEALREFQDDKYRVMKESDETRRDLYITFQSKLNELAQSGLTITPTQKEACHKTLPQVLYNAVKKTIPITDGRWSPQVDVQLDVEVPGFVSFSGSENDSPTASNASTVVDAIDSRGRQSPPSDSGAEDSDDSEASLAASVELELKRQVSGGM